jgi:hypothetical protein
MSNFLTREEWLSAAVAELRPLFIANGYPLPDRIRVSCSFPSQHARSLNRAIGEHWSSAASDDGTHEILISQVIDDPMEVLGVLIHELSHAATDGDGHRGRFVGCVRSFSLEGKPSATTIGAAFHEDFSPLAESLGAYPHGRLNVSAIRKTQSTRMLKAFCPGCGYTIRLSARWAMRGDQVNVPYCPSCPAVRFHLV